MKIFKKYKFIIWSNYSDECCDCCGQYAFDAMGKCMNCGNYIGI
jgi:predicted ATP-dependent serine protease